MELSRGKAGRPSGDPLAAVSVSGEGMVPPQHSRDAWWWCLVALGLDSEAGSTNTVTQRHIISQFVTLQMMNESVNAHEEKYNSIHSSGNKYVFGSVMCFLCSHYCSHDESFHFPIGKKPKNITETTGTFFADMSHVDTGHLFLACLSVWSTIAPVKSIIYLEFTKLSNKQPMSGIIKVLLMHLSNGSDTWL